MNQKELIEKVKNVSSNSGIYLWKDSLGNVIYVGKAKNLKKRMIQYFEGSLNSYKTSKLVNEIADFEIFICRNNKEALLLEKHYIEKFNPEYNILLLDDKRYPYLKIELKRNSLDIALSRKVKKWKNNNVFYFGPFPNGYGASIVLKLIQREAYFKDGLKIQNSDYNFWKMQFLKIKNILSFQKTNYLQELKNKMLTAADNMQFEIALDLKKSIDYLTKLKEDQIVELQKLKNLDVLVYKVVDNIVYITILFYRSGMLINKDNQNIEINFELKETLSIFLEKYYSNKILPEELLVDKEFINLEINNNFKLLNPKIGAYKKALDIAKLNLEDYVVNKHHSILNNLQHSKKMMTKLSTILKIENIESIIMFDNSNVNNYNPVGVAVVYLKGQKHKELYKKFNLTADKTRLADVEYMKQSVTRYFTNESTRKNFDLIIVDGGIAQVHEVKNIIKNLKLNIKTIGLVKDEYHKTKSLIDLWENNINIEDKELLNFLAEIQIEVDRFAKSHLRKRQRITSMEGKLQQIKGLGIVMENKLLAHFKNYNAIYNATLEELNKIVPKKIAEQIFEKKYLK
ncbi:GIY-YIG nuclease family protein [Mycoplasmopsis lipofaciens]|uniref:GIY-YIG nuclease family protein n=1 Tax=Mycoplasmopsis lipofaciens TaxID=114884 RepID=UPI00048A1487|nr:GIY-YIG nuclease family protein [Mycoplasmopsis lipofaciens]